MNISTVIITLDEENDIERCLKSIQPISDEIVVVDSGSTDKTVEITKKYTDKIYYHAFEGHVQQKNYAVSRAKYQWILSLDADEELSDELRHSILEIKSREPTVQGFSVNRKTYYLTDWFTQGGWYPDTKIRLFNKEKARWVGQNPHDYIKLDDNKNCAHLRGDLLHYTYQDLSDHINTIQKFSSIAAQEKKKAHKKRASLHLFFNPIIKFIKTYFIKRACLEGTRGFVFSVMAAFSVFMKYAKLWEIDIKHKK